MMYYRFKESINIISGIETSPSLAADISFLAGRLIQAQIPLPLRFTINHPEGEMPRHLLDNVIPVASKHFINTLIAAGIDNIQTFPAVLHQSSTGNDYIDYVAFNVIGLVDAVDADASISDVIMPGDDDGLPALVDFKELVFAKSKTRGLPLFRLVQNPLDVYVIDYVMEYMRSHKPEGGWGLTTYEVPVR